MLLHLIPFHFLDHYSARSAPSRVVAIGLVWQWGAAPHRSAWRGLAWGMLPLLLGAMCACTWHFFYNAPELEVLCVTVVSVYTLHWNPCYYFYYTAYNAVLMYHPRVRLI